MKRTCVGVLILRKRRNNSTEHSTLSYNQLSDYFFHCGETVSASNLYEMQLTPTNSISHPLSLSLCLSYFFQINVPIEHFNSKT